MCVCGGGGEGGEFYSGKGSDDIFAVKYAELIREFIQEKAAESIVDLGCGDFRVASRFASEVDSYIGIDVVEELIQYNRGQYSNEKVQFKYLDIAEEELPDGEICLIRQVLQHLCNNDIQRVISKLSKYRYAIITEHQLQKPSNVVNMDKISGMHTRLFYRSGVYLEQAPFNCKIEQAIQLPYDEHSYLQVYIINCENEAIN